MPGTTGTNSSVAVPWIMTDPWANETGVPAGAVVPSELTVNAKMPVLLPGHNVLALMMAYAKAPAGSTTIEEGKPFRTHVELAVEEGGLPIAETWPLPRLKLNVSINPEP